MAAAAAAHAADRIANDDGENEDAARIVARDLEPC